MFYPNQPFKMDIFCFPQVVSWPFPWHQWISMDLHGSPRAAAELPQFFAQMTQEDVPLRVPIEEAWEIGPKVHHEVPEWKKPLESHGE